MSARLLEVEALEVEFRGDDGVVRAVDGVSLAVDAGEVLAVVGESGSGKSATALSVLGLTRAAGATLRGSIRFRGRELLGASERELRAVRGDEIAMIFQDPMTSLNPLRRVGGQIAEQIRAHRDVSRAEARERAVAMMERAGIPRAADRARAYPHELSGGLRQRVMIAMALSCDPALLVADEPTTALDVTVQAQILERLRALCDETGAGILLVTHDFGVVAEIADRVAVMRAGRIVEHGRVDDVFDEPRDPYTRALLAAIPRLDRPLAPREVR